MPLTIKDIKKDLKKSNVLDHVYDIYERLRNKEDLTANDLIVQVWINLKIKEGFKMKYLIRKIPKDQSWLKAQYIRGLIGNPKRDYTKVIEALKECDPPGIDELDYIHSHLPVRGLGSAVNIVNSSKI